MSEICRNMNLGCEGTHAVQVYQERVSPGAGWYDVTHPKAGPFPALSMQGVLTQYSVLSASGVPVNFVREPLSLRSCYSSLPLIRCDSRDDCLEQKLITRCVVFQRSRDWEQLQ